MFIVWKRETCPEATDELKAWY